MIEKFSYNKKDYSSLSKTKIGKIIRLLIDPEYRFNAKVRFCLTDSMSDEEFIKRKFKAFCGYDLDLDNPKTFNEKLNWLKLHGRNPEYTRMADKYEFKNYVTEKLGPGHVIDLLGVYNNFD